MEWTSERAQELTALWVGGWSGSKIAERFSISRCAVLGKVNRMGLRGIPREISPHKLIKKQPRPKLMSTDRKPPPPSEPVKQQPLKRKRHPVILIHLKPDGCKFPVGIDITGRHWFCNEHTQTDSPYCPKHHAKCHGREYG